MDHRPGARFAVLPEGQPSHAAQYFSSSELGLESDGVTYLEGAPCPTHATVPAGWRRRELHSDGRGGWVGRKRSAE